MATERDDEGTPRERGDERAMIAANRSSWEVTAALHQESQLPRLLAAFEDPGFTTLDEVETAVYAAVGLEGKRVLQPCCNNGRELLSLVRLGAAGGVGVDLASGNLDAAQRLARVAGLQDVVRFVQADVLELPETLGRFQLAVITVGALGWLPRLRPLFDGIAARLDPGGHLVIYEMHPVLDMYEAASGLTPVHDYYDRSPQAEASGPDYYEPDRIVEQTSYWFHHTLGDIVGGVLAAGLTLERFEEHDHDVSMVYRAFQELPTRPPLSYTLVARKPAPLPRQPQGGARGA